jgi:hypothetical protein
MWRTVWQAVGKSNTAEAVQDSYRQNEKTRQKAGFSGVPEILKAFSGTLYGAAPDERYVSARLGFPGVWSSLENSAYPN